MEQYVVLVNEKDEAQGTIEKMEAHVKGLLHRAFSVFVFNTKDELLLQRRALTKYHSGGLWTNTCCSHPRPNEDVFSAAHRRLQEELGFDCVLEKAFSFVYYAALDNGLIEHEFDHVFIGISEEKCLMNKEEVEEIAYKSMATLKDEIKSQPEQFTEWFKIALPKLEAYLQINNKDYQTA
jgi:isopentenyl-diphosphate Delta-isomerase